MNIQEAAMSSGLTADTIRFYERRGILPAPPRSLSGYRNYTEEHVLTLSLANGLRRLGVPLKDVASILKVVHEGSCGEIRHSLMTRLTVALPAIDSRIEELKRLRGQVEKILGGLDSMALGDEAVPGMETCSCIRLVAGS